MKIFALVILVAAILGGFIGGDLTGTDFTILGATIGGVGTFSVLMLLGAYFSRQDDKKNNNVKLTPEIRTIFERKLKEKEKLLSGAGKLNHPAFDNFPKELRGVVNDLVKQDLDMIARGEIPERRLIPHHAIKRDIILSAYLKDFSNLSASMQKLNKDDYESKVIKIKMLRHEDLDKLIEIMKIERADLEDLEFIVRRDKKIYSIVDPIFR